MKQGEVEQVLRNWIAQASAPIGQLPSGVYRPQWIAQQFAHWWRAQAADELGAVEFAIACIREELERLGGWSNPEFGEAMHELTHATEALAALHGTLGLDEQ